jgi:hypothetical protein
MTTARLHHAHDPLLLITACGGQAKTAAGEVRSVIDVTMTTTRLRRAVQVRADITLRFRNNGAAVH